MIQFGGQTTFTNNRSFLEFWVVQKWREDDYISHSVRSQLDKNLKYVTDDTLMNLIHEPKTVKCI